MATPCVVQVFCPLFVCYVVRYMEVLMSYIVGPIVLLCHIKLYLSDLMQHSSLIA